MRGKGKGRFQVRFWLSGYMALSLSRLLLHYYPPAGVKGEAGGHEVVGRRPKGTDGKCHDREGGCGRYP